MAGKNIFGKVIENVKIPNVINTNILNTNNLKKEIDGKVKEKNQMYSLIGMEIYDQCREKGLEIPGIERYLEKMQELDGEIVELEKQKQSMELQQKGTTVCQCGNVLNANQSFCTNCGRMVNNGRLVCVCGQEVSKNEKFCPHCGMNVQQLMQGGVQPGMQQGMAQPVMMQPGLQQPVKTCICGAKVPEGQFMCMECGRKME